jgi:hypothetical protein
MKSGGEIPFKANVLYTGWIPFFFTEVRAAASNSAYYCYPEMWILRYPAHRYHAEPSPGFKLTTPSDILTIRPRRSTTTLDQSYM